MKKLILFIFLFISICTFAQFTPIRVVDELVLHPTDTTRLKNDFASINQYNFQFFSIERNFSFGQDLPAFNLNTDHLPGFFCKLEYKLEGRSKLAPRFRLGSLNYTEWMEGKGEWYNRYK